MATAAGIFFSAGDSGSRIVQAGDAIFFLGFLAGRIQFHEEPEVDRLRILICSGTFSDLDPEGFGAVIDATLVSAWKIVIMGSVKAGWIIVRGRHVRSRNLEKAVSKGTGSGMLRFLVG